MNSVMLTLLSATAVALTLPLAAKVQSATPPAGWSLVWADEFETDGLPDPDKWGYDVGGHGWGNDELQYYTESDPANARVENGHLIIEAHKQSFQGSEYTSARLVTRDYAAWKYGRFEIRAKLPPARGTWSAIWMLPVDWNLGSGKWPDVGEIDIMEHVGFDLGTVHASAHSKVHHYKSKEGPQITSDTFIPDATETFHTYVMEWSESQIKAYVDDQLYFTYQDPGLGWQNWPYQRDFYLILNIAVGGDWGGAKGIDSNSFPQRMEVDYVRIYQPNTD